MRQPASTAHPGEAALNDPTLWQQDEAAFSLWGLHDEQVDAVLGGAGEWIGTRVALIDVGDLDVLASDGLHLSGQRLRLHAFIFTSWRHRERQRIAQRIHGGMDLRALAPLA